MIRQAEGFLWHTDCQARHMPVARAGCSGPEGAILPDCAEDEDQIAVVYDKGETPPRITVTNAAAQVQTVHADGVAVAIVARAHGPGLTAEDVLLVERFVTSAR